MAQSDPRANPQLPSAYGANGQLMPEWQFEEQNAGNPFLMKLMGAGTYGPGAVLGSIPNWQDQMRGFYASAAMAGAPRQAPAPAPAPAPPPAPITPVPNYPSAPAQPNFANLGNSQQSNNMAQAQHDALNASLMNVLGGNNYQVPSSVQQNAPQVGASPRQLPSFLPGM